MPLGRKMLLLAAFCGLAWSQTGLTTIQDTLFKADGTRFSGTITIVWNTFDAVNLGTVVQQSKSVPVVNGILYVQLAPNAQAAAPANTYSVLYQSDGREQFAETWSVPASSQALKVSAVRTATVATGGGLVGNQTPILESSVVGLQADLASRPRKGVGYGTNRVAIVDDAGAIETAVGDVGDCVYVDGTAGPCGAPVFADAETPGGIVDGANATLTLAATPLGSSLMLFRNGLFQTPNFDYVLTDATIAFNPGAVPQSGDTLTASYRVDTSAGNVAAGAPAGQPAGIAAGAIRSAFAQLICSGAGSQTASVNWVSLGSCDIPAASLQPGDRIELRFSVAHSGAVAGFDLQVKWGATAILSRHGSARDAAVAGRAEAAITGAGAQLTVESWGTVLPFLPGILNSPAQTHLKLDFTGKMSSGTSDGLTLINYTVLRYPRT